jgi:X-Pro dipeptidyl-peptidase (S15 family)
MELSLRPTVIQHRTMSATCNVVLALALFASPIGRAVSQSPNEAIPSTDHEVRASTASGKPQQGKEYIEHWDVLPLAGNNLPAMPPLLGEKDDLPDFTRELIQVQWRPGDAIDLYIIRPKHAIKPPVIIFLYGYPSDTDRFRDDTYCNAIVKRGFAAVGFVSALTGHRYHDLPMKEWFISELEKSLGASVHDVQMIINYLQTRDDMDMGRVGMYGQGSGGTIAILSASADQRIKAVDVLDPWGDWPDWLASSPLIPDDERANYLTPEFQRSISPLDPILSLPRLSSRPLRLQQTAFSEVTPSAARKRIEASVPSTGQKLEYKSAEDYDELAAHGANILAWLQDRLGSKGRPE